MDRGEIDIYRNGDFFENISKYYLICKQNLYTNSILWNLCSTPTQISCLSAHLLAKSLFILSWCESWKQTFIMFTLKTLLNVGDLQLKSK